MRSMRCPWQPIRAGTPLRVCMSTRRGLPDDGGGTASPSDGRRFKEKVSQFVVMRENLAH